MLDDPLFIFAAIACIAVLIVLVLGIGSFGIGGKTAHKYSNKLMRLRIVAQAIAVGAILLMVWMRTGN